MIALRALSAVCLVGVLCAVFCTYALRQRKRDDASTLTLQHAALNLALFPPLFFFSAMYYTDAASTLSVLIFYSYFLYTEKTVGARRRWWHSLVRVVLGVASLMFRQTNIFWVAVFPAGIELVQHLDRGHEVVKDSMYRRIEGFSDTLISLARTSWKMEVIYNPSVRDAWMEGTFHPYQLT